MAVSTHKASPKAPAQPTRKEPLAPNVKTTLKGHEKRVYDVAFIRGTRLLVTGSADKSLRVWDLDKGKQVGEPLFGHDTEVWRVAPSPDGLWIVSGGGNGSILVWEVATNKRDLKRVPMSFEAHKGGIQGVVFAPDSETLASASWDKTVCVWKRETGKIVLGPLKVGSGANSVSYSPDGKKLAAGTQQYIIIWNTKTGEELLKIEQRAYQVAFTPDGLRLISGNREDIRISDATTGDIIKQFDAHTDENFHSLAIAPNGTKFATTSYDKTTRAPIPTSRFFDDFDPHSPPGRNNHAATATRHAEGSKINNMMNRLFSRFSAPQGHAPRPRRIPLVDVFATRGKYRTANAHSGKRHKLMQLQRPPRKQAHVGASNSSMPAGVIGGATSATLQTGSTSASATTLRPPSPLDTEHVPDASCFAILIKCFP
ncbi:WD40 repeat-like protein, partial [Suillus weaverae]